MVTLVGGLARLIVYNIKFQGQKDLPAAFDKQEKDQFVADCKEVSLFVFKSLSIHLLHYLYFQSLNTASESYKKIYWFSWKCFQVCE